MTNQVALLSVASNHYAHENGTWDQLRNSTPYASVARAKEQAENDAGGTEALVWHEEPNGESWAEDDADNVWLVRLVTITE